MRNRKLALLALLTALVTSDADASKSCSKDSDCAGMDTCVGIPCARCCWVDEPEKD